MLFRSPPQAPAPPPLAKTSSAATPSPPTVHQSPGQRPRGLPPYGQHLMASGEDSEKGEPTDPEMDIGSISYTLYRILESNPYP